MMDMLVLILSGLSIAIGVIALLIGSLGPVSYKHLRAHETLMNLVCRLLLE